MRNFSYAVTASAILLGLASPASSEIDPYAIMEAEGADTHVGDSIMSLYGHTAYDNKPVPCEMSNGKKHVTGIDNGDRLVFKAVDFSTGASLVQARVTSWFDTAGTIELRLDSEDGPLISTIKVPNTWGWGKGPKGKQWPQDSWWLVGFRVVSAPVTGASGIHDVHVIFRTKHTSAFDVDYFKFHKRISPRSLYVATTGNDSNNGTSVTTPVKSIAKAISLLTPGDTLNIRGGTYGEQIVTNWTVSGTADHPVVIRAYPGETPVFKASLVTPKIDAYAGFIQNTGDYIVFDGLKLSGSTGMGTNNMGDYCIFKNLIIDSSFRDGMGGATGHFSKYINNDVGYSSRVNFPRDETKGGTPGCMGIFESRGVEIIGNFVHDGNGEGIIAWKRAYNYTIKNNIVKDVFSAGIYIDNAIECVVEGNLVYCTETEWVAQFGSSNSMRLFYGICQADENYDSFDETYNVPGTTGRTKWEPGRDNVIRNNYVLNSRNGINIFGWQYSGMQGTGIYNTKVINNTVINVWEFAFGATGYTRGNTHGLVVRNNIFHSKGNPSNEKMAIFLADAGSDVKFENNLLYDERFPDATTAGKIFTWGATDNAQPCDWDSLNNIPGFTGNAYGKPAMVGFGNLTGTPAEVVARAKLVGSSHNVFDKGTGTDAGTISGAPSVDYFGVARPIGGYDIGAEEFAGPRLPLPQAVSPSAGVNVAFKKPVTVNSAADGNSGSNAVDGDVTTKWSAVWKDEYWIIIDLGQLHNLDRWVVRHAGAAGGETRGNTSDFKLQASSDGISYTNYDVVKGNTANVTDRVLREGFVARYVRIHITKPSLNDPHVNIQEIELYWTGSKPMPNSAARIRPVRHTSAATTFTVYDLRGARVGTATAANNGSRLGNQTRYSTAVYLMKGTTVGANRLRPHVDLSK